MSANRFSPRRRAIFTPPMIELIGSRWNGDVVRRDICAEIEAAFGVAVTMEQVSGIVQRYGFVRSPAWSERQRKSRQGSMERALERRWLEWAYPVERADVVAPPAAPIRYEGGFSMLGGRVR